MSGQADKLQALHEEIASLGNERGKLGGELERRLRENEKNRELLEDLARGVLPGARKRTILYSAIAVIMAAALIILWRYWGADEERVPKTPRILQRKLVPHLMITSSPTAARVSVGGRAVGRTPLVLRSPKKQGEVLVDVEAPGYSPTRGALPVSLSGGAHWHVVLKKRAE